MEEYNTGENREVAYHRAGFEQRGRDKNLNSGEDSGHTRILVPLDGSLLAEMALPHAIELAEATSSGLLLLRVVPPITLVEPMGGLIEAAPQAWDLYGNQREDAERYMEDVVERLRPSGLDIQPLVTGGDESGSIVGVAESILQYAREHPEIVAIALSTHGRSGLGRWLFGSVAEKVLHSSPVPLLLIRPDSEPKRVDLGVVPHYKTFLVPLDSSPVAEQALDYAEALAQAVRGRLVLISVTSTPFDLKLVKREMNAEWSAVPWGTPAERLVKYMDGISEKLADSGVPVQARVTNGEITDEILKAAKYEGVDVIVMATHGRSGLGHLLIGSIAGRVAQAAPIPLLLIRSKKQPADEQAVEDAQHRH
jgi:nucleotide-binding universal stress UspA family protein